MPGKSKKRSRSRKGLRLFIMPIFILLLSLSWIWKADSVKTKYSKMKELEQAKKELISLNSLNKARLMELKSITAIGEIASSRYQLTQNVKQRINIVDPVKRQKIDEKFKFVSKESVIDWVDDAMFKSGQIYAKEKEGE